MPGKNEAEPEMERVKQLVSASLLKRTVGEHLDADMLAAFGENALTRDQREGVLAHLATCPNCRETLYLAQPELSEVQIGAVHRPSRISHFAMRWAAVASVLIVAGGLFLTKREFFRTGQEPAQNPAPAAGYDKVAAEKTPAELDSVQRANPRAPAKVVPPAVAQKIRPEAKHMTAKMQAPLQIENSDEVRLSTSARTRDEATAGARDLRAQGGTSFGAAPAVAPNNGAAIAHVPADNKPADNKKDVSGLVVNGQNTGALVANTGTALGGVVLDPSGAAIANANVTLKGPSGTTIVTSSDQAGKFAFNDLAAGSYSVKAEANGFKSAEVTQVAVLDNKNSNLPIRLDVGTTSEAVEVTSATPTINAVETAKGAGTGIGSETTNSETVEVARDRKHKASTFADKENRQFAKATSSTATNSSALWALSSNGAVHKSNNSGKTWTGVSIPGSGARFTAIFSSGQQVWVGGSAGTLFHSMDSGVTWTRETPGAGEQKMQGDVTHIAFSDPQNGTVSVSTGEEWLTSDGGQTWRKK